MAVDVWVGEKPEHANERRAVVTLARALDQLDGEYLVLANFSVGGRAIDLAVIKHDGLFVIELKHVDGKVFGDVNGPWHAESGNGEGKRLNPGRKNPYNQIISNYYALINLLNEKRESFLTAHKATTIDFRITRRLVVIAPTIQEGSKVETDWKVAVCGLDALPAFVMTERSAELDLSPTEMRAIPELLRCDRWDEVNTLVRTSTLPAPAPVPVAAAAPSAPAVAQPLSVGTWRGRIGIAALLCTLLIVAAALVQGVTGQGRVVRSVATSEVPTSLPAGGVGAGAVEIGADSCVWRGYQPVGRRWDTGANSWENVGVDPLVALPDVVVTLEEVSFCEGRIVLTWSVRNNQISETIAVALDASNLRLRDTLGNEYTPVGETQMRAPPGERAIGTAVIERPAHLGATTLVVRLLREPFGEATWLVPVPAQQS